MRTMDIFKMQSYPKRTALIDDRGIILRVFRSRTDAASCTDCDQSAISKYCNGKRVQPIKGFKFKTISNELYKKLKDVKQ